MAPDTAPTVRKQTEFVTSTIMLAAGGHLVHDMYPVRWSWC